MDKELRKYEKFIATEVKKRENGDKNQIAKLYQYHVDRVREFQHERLIHLQVTLFFGGVLLLSVIAYIVYALSSASTTLYIPMFILIVILFITEVFYVRHYYVLENGTQRLYRFTEQLYKLL